jgi:nucleoside-diphosphate-sugar epimerase
MNGMAKLIVGCGYLGRRAAKRWGDAGEQVYAVTRSAERAVEFQQQGIEPVVADVTDRASLQGLPMAETLLYAVGFDRSANQPMREVYVDGLRNVLDALPGGVRRVIYISSTSVYSQGGGVWVDETSETRPLRENGCICLEAEQLLRQHRLGDRAIILRLAGIYGPGRIPRLATLLAGEPIAAPSDGYLNLIHVDDAASIVLAAEERAAPPCLYTVSDGQPPIRADYYAELARIAGAPPPRFSTPDPNSHAALRAESNKRISNRRLMTDLAVTLQYPSYREGLAAILNQLSI